MGHDHVTFGAERGDGALGVGEPRIAVLVNGGVGAGGDREKVGVI